MSIWQTLGIEPTDDLEAIKQTYAAQAKRYHPEEHPEAFRTLHDAYRQAVRYARQHPAASTLQKNTAASAPAAPAPAFKPSYHLPRPIDNPCRAPKYPSADDVFNAKQFEEIRRENKNFHHSEPCKHSVPSDELPHGKLPIRGSGTTPEPSDGLRFDVLDQTGDDCEAGCPPAETSSAPAEIPTEAPASPPETPVKKSHPFVKAWLLLVLWVFLLGLFAESIHPIITLVLYVALYVRLFRTIRDRWLLSFFAAGVDFISVAFLNIAAERFSVAASMDHFFVVLALVLPALRIGWRIHAVMSQKNTKKGL